jgi:hypothetical protein
MVCAAGIGHHPERPSAITYLNVTGAVDRHLRMRVCAHVRPNGGRFPDRWRSRCRNLQPLAASDEADIRA